VDKKGRENCEEKEKYVGRVVKKKSVRCRERGKKEGGEGVGGI